MPLFIKTIRLLKYENLTTISKNQPYDRLFSTLFLFSPCVSTWCDDGHKNETLQVHKRLNHFKTTLYFDKYHSNTKITRNYPTTCCKHW